MNINWGQIGRILRRPISIVVMVAVALGLVAWLGVSIFQRSVDNDGIGRQRDIMTLQRDVGIKLSKCLDQTNIARQITQQQYASVKDILTAALSARYVDANNKPTRADSTLGGGAFISSLHEQYPAVDTKQWASFMSVAVGCRNNVYDAQSRLQVFAGDFDKWRQTGGIFAHSVRAKFPTRALYVYDPNKHEVVYAAVALEYLTRTILTSKAQDAINSGTMPDQDLSPPSSPASSVPAPASS